MEPSAPLTVSTTDAPALSRMSGLQQSIKTRTPKRKAVSEASAARPIVISAQDFPIRSSALPTTNELLSSSSTGPTSRASKMNAAVKLDTKTVPNPQSPSASLPSPPADPSFPHFSKNPAVVQAQIPKAPVFDMTTVKTIAPRDPPQRTQPRAFGLQEAPTFYPTWEEFKDPMAYVGKIVSEYGADKYGIAKIVPPEGWQPPFVMNTETFRFKTRLMRLNSIEAKSRAKINFFEQLVMYHQQQGNPRLTVPVVDHKEVDLWLLRSEVNKLGGYDKATQDRKWADISRKIGSSQPFSHQIRMVYNRVILPFEQYAARAKSTQSPPKPSNSSVVAPIPVPSASLPSAFASTPMGKLSNSQFPPTPSSRPHRGSGQKKVYDEDGESSLSEPDSDTDADLSRPVFAPPLVKLPKKDIPVIKGEECEVCRSGAHGTKILLCDGCDSGYHIYCLDPPLSAVPKNESWFCAACLMSAGAEFGFDEGEEHSLSSFQARDTAFRNHWWSTHPPKQKSHLSVPPAFADSIPASVSNGVTQQIGGVDVSEHDVEMEFWRLVESQTETVEVEYGADVHVTLHGSGAPTVETHPLEPYSVDQWNLNIMPILPSSVLRYIKTNISGMTVPWIYVGFAFSAFCWHNEDHHTSSVNYMHWGETKTWYGVPGEYSSAFEDAMRSEAPDLFEQQPSLLFQLVTLMSPARIIKAGVPVYACDQRPNEFVITFPKAYHAGFNHGLNYNEAVNFAQPEWLEHGLGCVQNYKKYSKPPVFSHDELLISISTHSKSIKTALWLKPHVEEMVARELKAREIARNQLSTSTPFIETFQTEDLPEEEYQCVSCKAYCYLAQVTCACTRDVGCLDHAAQLCGCDLSQKSLRLRFSDDALRDLEKQVSDRAGSPEAWKTRLRKAVFETKRPSLRQLRTLVAEGKQINYSLPDLAPLEVFVERANDIVLEASSFTVRKQQSRKQGRKSRSVAPEDASVPVEDFASRPGIEVVIDLLSQVETLGFEAPEISHLETLLSTALEFQFQAFNSLSLPDEQQSLIECEALFNSGLALGLNLPELHSYSRLVRRLRWVRDLEEVDEATLEMKDIDTFIEEALTSEVPLDHPFVLDLQAKKVSSDSWAGDVDRILGSSAATMAGLESLLARSRSVAVDADRLHRLQALRSRVLDTERAARLLIESLANSDDRSAVAMDLQRFLKRVEAKGECSIQIPDLEILKSEASSYTTFFDTLNALLPASKGDKRPLADRLQSLLSRITTSTTPEDNFPTTPSTSLAVASSSSLPSADQASTKPIDLPLPFSCVCRNPETSDMLRCKHCKATYHGGCVGLVDGASKSSKRPYACFICEPTKADLSQSASLKLSNLADLLQVGFKYPPSELVVVTSIVEKIHHFFSFLIPRLQAARLLTVGNSEELALMRHLVRKVDGLGVDTEIPSSENQLVGLRPTLLSTIVALNQLTAAPGDKKRMRNRKPKWDVLQQGPTHSQECLCKVSKDEMLVICSNQRCGRGYHPSCVLIPPSVDAASIAKFKCPLCCVLTGTKYRFAICLLQMQEHEGTLHYVNVKATLNAIDTLIFIDIDPSQQTCLPFTATKFHPGARSDPEEDAGPAPMKRTKAEPHAAGLMENVEETENFSALHAHVAPTIVPSGPSERMPPPTANSSQYPPYQPIASSSGGQAPLYPPNPPPLEEPYFYSLYSSFPPQPAYHFDPAHPQPGHYEPQFDYQSHGQPYPHPLSFCAPDGPPSPWYAQRGPADVAEEETLADGVTE